MDSRRCVWGTGATRQLSRLESLPEVLDDAVEHWHRGLDRGWTPASTIVGRSADMIEGYLAGALAHDPFVSLELPTGWDGADQWRVDASRAVEAWVRLSLRHI